MNNGFNCTGSDQMVHIHLELAQLIINSGTIRKTPGNRKLRFHAADNNRLRKHLTAPRANHTHPRNAAGQKDQPRRLGRCTFLRLPQAFHKHLMKAAVIEALRLFIQQVIGSFTIHAQRQFYRNHAPVDGDRLHTFMIRPVFFIREVPFL